MIPAQNTMLTRDQAWAIILDALKTVPAPTIDYQTGWVNVLANALCVDKRHLCNRACMGRDSLRKLEGLGYRSARK